MARFSRRTLPTAIVVMTLPLLLLLGCSSGAHVDSMVKNFSTGEIVLKDTRDQRHLVVTRVLDSRSLGNGTYVLVTFKTDDPSVQEVMATVEKGDVITWTHLYPLDTSGYVSGWELVKGYDTDGELLGEPLGRFDG